MSGTPILILRRRILSIDVAEKSVSGSSNSEETDLRTFQSSACNKKDPKQSQIGCVAILARRIHNK
jgi:hypothetical protein